MEPSKEEIDRLKAKFPDRSLRLVEMSDDDEVFHFVMTGPNREEYRKFTDDMMTAKDAKTEKDRIEQLGAAVERTALAMIRWPEREEVKQIFDNRPALSAEFSEQIHKAAGSSFEVRTKKL